jgi:hypothetical protein
MRSRRQIPEKPFAGQMNTFASGTYLNAVFWRVSKEGGFWAI